MNSLSWFLYIADVAAKIGTNMGILGFVMGLAGGIMIIPGYFVHWDDEERSAQIKNNKQNVAWFASRFFVVGLFACFVSLLIPSKQTLYMIAASEMGEVVVESEEAKEIFHELKETVINQLRYYRNYRINEKEKNNER